MLRTRVSGQGPTLVLVHGLLMDESMFDSLVVLLQANRLVVVPTLRGHGDDGRSPARTVEENAAEVLAAVAEVAPGPLEVLGYSQGGAVAQAMAVQAPGQVEALVLCCTFAFNGMTAKERLELKLMPFLVRLLGVEGLARWLPRSAPELSRSQRDAMAAVIRRGRTQSALAALAALRGFDGRPSLSRIRCPTLVIAGGRDTAVPAHHAEELRAGIVGAKLEVFDDATHTLAWTHAPRLAATVVAFLDSQRGSRRERP
jgi:3-oxoadipate enol-lactonase